MELNEQTQKAFGVVSKEEAEEINRERSLLDKIFNPIDSRVVSDDVKNLLLDPSVVDPEFDTRDLLALKSDEDFMEDYANAQNERAALKRKESENSFRNTGYDFLTERLNLDPSTAQGVVTAAEFVPFVGDLPMIEDAVDQFKRGDIKEGALTTTLAVSGIAFDGIPLIVKNLKRVKTDIPEEKVTPEEEALSSPLVPKMFVGEKAKLDETNIIPTVLSNLEPRTATKRLQDAKLDFRKFLANNSVKSSGNITADMKKMTPELREKTAKHLDKLWIDHGFTVGMNNKFFTEVDDGFIFRESPEKYFNFNKFIEEQNKVMSQGLPPTSKLMKLGDVFNHPQLYNAYPEFKNLGIRVRTRPQDADASDTPYEFVKGAYSKIDTAAPVGSEFYSGIALKAPANRFGLIKPFNEFTDAEKDSMISTLLHEIQHAVQHKEGILFPHGQLKQARKKQKEAVTMDILDINNRLKQGVTEKTADRLKGKRLQLLYQRDRLSVMDDDDFYYKLGKEVHARNVQNRRTWDALMRASFSPYKTITNPNASQISGEEIIRRASTNDKTGKIDFDKYRVLSNNIIENIKNKPKIVVPKVFSDVDTKELAEGIQQQKKGDTTFLEMGDYFTTEGSAKDVGFKNLADNRGTKTITDDSGNKVDINLYHRDDIGLFFTLDDISGTSGKMYIAENDAINNALFRKNDITAYSPQSELTETYGPNVQIRMILLDQLGYDIKDLDKLAREAGGSNSEKFRKDFKQKTQSFTRVSMRPEDIVDYDEKAALKTSRKDRFPLPEIRESSSKSDIRQTFMPEESTQDKLRRYLKDAPDLLKMMGLSEKSIGKPPSDNVKKYKEVGGLYFRKLQKENKKLLEEVSKQLPLIQKADDELVKKVISQGGFGGFKIGDRLISSKGNPYTVTGMGFNRISPQNLEREFGKNSIDRKIRNEGNFINPILFKHKHIFDYDKDLVKKSGKNYYSVFEKEMLYRPYVKMKDKDGDENRHFVDMFFKGSRLPYEEPDKNLDYLMSRARYELSNSNPTFEIYEGPDKKYKRDMKQLYEPFFKKD